MVLSPQGLLLTFDEVGHIGMGAQYEAYDAAVCNLQRQRQGQNNGPQMEQSRPVVQLA